MRKYDTSEMDYDRYKEIQIARSDQKWHKAHFWKVSFNQFTSLMKEVWTIIPKPGLICCLGIRDGCEYLGFLRLELIGVNNIYGVDINPQIVNNVGKNCFAYDFNHLPQDWNNKFDFVYSNSIDHSYNIEETLREWHRICSGHIFISFSGGRVCASDIYSWKSVDDVVGTIDKNLFEVVKTWADEGGNHALLKVKK